MNWGAKNLKLHYLRSVIDLSCSKTLLKIVNLKDKQLWGQHVCRCFSFYSCIYGLAHCRKQISTRTAHVCLVVACCCLITDTVYYRFVYTYMCVWSVITGSWSSMLTQSCPGEWPFKINKQTHTHTSDPLKPQAAEFSMRLKIQIDERSTPSNPNRNTCSSPLSPALLPGRPATLRKNSF